MDTCGFAYVRIMEKLNFEVFSISGPSVITWSTQLSLWYPYAKMQSGGGGKRRPKFHCGSP